MQHTYAMSNTSAITQINIHEPKVHKSFEFSIKALVIFQFCSFLPLCHQIDRKGCSSHQCQEEVVEVDTILAENSHKVEDNNKEMEFEASEVVALV